MEYPKIRTTIVARSMAPASSLADETLHRRRQPHTEQEDDSDDDPTLHDRPPKP
jgi:hypothetical protein